MKIAPLTEKTCDCGKVFHARVGSMMATKGLCATCAEIYTEQITTGHITKAKKRTPEHCNKRGFHEWLTVAKNVMKCRVCKKEMAVA